MLETILWAEADRMRGLDIDDENLKNQQEILEKEVKVNVLNRRPRAVAGFGRANLLASFALFDDDRARINRFESEFGRVTPDSGEEDG